MAKNLAHVLAKVVRADWPRRWPDFFPQLLGRLQLDGDGGGDGNGGAPPSLQTVRAIHRSVRRFAHNRIQLIVSDIV
jgi:hypothetical protein